MRIRLAVTLDVGREPAPEPEQRETQLDAYVESAAEQPHQAPRVRFQTFERET